MPDVPALRDGFGRRVSVLRVSLTDRCNFRCVYCMPPEGAPVVPSSRRLDRDRIVRFVSAAVRLGVRRVRLTGGEPLLRPDVVAVVAALRPVLDATPPDPARPVELTMTTNGSRLAELAAPLRAAGLDRVNVSLDSLDARRFHEITGSRGLDRVTAGVDAAIGAGLAVKLNVVVLAGMPDEEILAFAETAVERRIDVRFLEFMPLCGSGWRPDLVYPIARVRAVIERRHRLVALPRDDRPARMFALAPRGGRGAPRGRVGFISNLTEPFCDACSRMRLTCDGRIRPCLFSDVELDVRPLLEPGVPRARLEDAIRAALAGKPWGSRYAARPFDPDAETHRPVRAAAGAGRGAAARNAAGAPRTAGTAGGGPLIRTIGG